MAKQEWIEVDEGTIANASRCDSGRCMIAASSWSICLLGQGRENKPGIRREGWSICQAPGREDDGVAQDVTRPKT